MSSAAALRDDARLFLAAQPGILLEEIFDGYFSLLKELGSKNVPLAVAASMHCYMLAAIATLPLDEDSVLSRSRSRLLETVRERRLLISNTGTDAANRSLNVGVSSTQARRVSGGYLISGKKRFMSLAKSADLAVISAQSADLGYGLFVVPMKQGACVEFWRQEFDTCFEEAETFGVEFRDAFARDGCYLAGDTATVLFAHGYQRSWFLSLIPAVYLGAAGRAIEIAREFAKESRGQPRLLCETDGVIVEAGKWAIEYAAAAGLCWWARDCLLAVGRSGRDGQRAAVTRALDKSALAKYQATLAAEAIVHRIVQFCGTDSFAPDSELGRLAQHVSFGKLHPVIHAQYERTKGADLFANGAPVL